LARRRREAGADQRDDGVAADRFRHLGADVDVLADGLGDGDGVSGNLREITLNTISGIAATRSKLTPNGNTEGTLSVAPGSTASKLMTASPARACAWAHCPN
jgi:hypothetical protein